MAPAPHRGAAAPVLVAPPTAAEHPVRTVDLAVVDVPAPLPDVADHVVEAPGVRCDGRSTSPRPARRRSCAPGAAVRPPLGSYSRSLLARLPKHHREHARVRVGGDDV